MWWFNAGSDVGEENAQDEIYWEKAREKERIMKLRLL